MVLSLYGAIRIEHMVQVGGFTGITILRMTQKTGHVKGIKLVAYCQVSKYLKSSNSQANDVSILTVYFVRRVIFCVFLKKPTGGGLFRCVFPFSCFPPHKTPKKTHTVPFDCPSSSLSSKVRILFQNGYTLIYFQYVILASCRN